MKYKFYSNKAFIQMLTRSLNSEHLCHAYLFYGAKGIGKKTLANYFAMGVLCKSEEKPCYQCSSCHKFLTGNHPDVHIVGIEDNKKSISVDTIRKLRQDAYIKPNESKVQVYIIPNIETMSIGAFNAFLKVLEEPPETAMFILTAESKAAVPETILSRCISYPLYPLSYEECVQALKELAPEKEEASIEKAAIHSNGILGKALEIINSESYSEVELISNAILEGILQRNEYEVLKVLTNMKADKEKLSNLINELTRVIRNIVLTKVNAQQPVDDQIEALSYKITLTQANKLVEVLQQSNDYMQSNMNVGLLVNWLCAQIFSVLS
ncbi:DNA polymerase III subunit delta' [Paludicola sp. MB14-C6]|uniref:DNA polymerase III subunit n=1 Tax=Paludihabitans sp. MB14-C6 TaxID=3070656 RepID=UPI0027DB967E|nr:DNA polymerase III subunit delta' [Paludicola sp. MB14-C6]WMJ22551.1 DNA polymerase III subunit delta' [Paludicola sp. MB14-C6]